MLHLKTNLEGEGKISVKIFAIERLIIAAKLKADQSYIAVFLVFV